MTTTTKDTVVIIRAKAFRGEGIREHRVMVTGDVVRVWDSAAGYFTNCHCLSRTAIRRAREAVAQSE